MPVPTVCSICKMRDQQGEPGATTDMACARCGRYQITIQAMHELRDAPDAARPLMAGWVRSQNRLGSIPLINVETIALVRTLPQLEFMERARRLLIYLAEKTEMLGRRVSAVVPEVGALLQTFENNEIGYVARFLQEQGWAHFDPANGETQLTGKGFVQADEWRRSHVASTQGFVAMWFDDDLQAAWTDGFARAISEAGYKPQRIDKKEHVNKICDEIVAEIRRSRFVVADFTGHRGGVYFEAGFAQGLGLPVVWTCQKSALKELHFDVRQYNCIDWETPAELAARLEARITAVIGDGPFKKGA
jgi:hypothetical protein